MSLARGAEIAVVYGGGLAQGLALVSFPAAATILTAADGYGFSSNQYGSIFLPLFIGSVLASLLAPTLARWKGLKAVLLAGFGCNAVSMGTFALSSTLAGSPLVAFAMILVATGLLGIGFGSTLTAINAYAASFFPNRSETAITALHTLLGTGTALAPLIVSLLSDGGGWWLLPLAIAIAAVILALVALTQPLILATATGAASLGAFEVARALPRRFWIWIAFALLYGICETLFGNWGTVYLHQQRALLDATANLALAVFWAAVTIGRLLVALLSTRISPLLIFRALPVLITAALVCVAWSSSAVFGVAAFALAGLACSACLPLSIGTASSETPRFVETASGWMVAAYMIGYGIGAFAVGPLRQLADLQLSEVYFGAAAIAVLLIVLANVLVAGSRAGTAPNSAASTRH
ncbi:MAG: MFS transporter [Rhodospirillales bacterium]|nr:MFS transporter [Rhodospirillales bacterium]